MNKSGKRFVGVLLAVLILSALTVSALADETTYTVRLFGGIGGLDIDEGQRATFANGSNVMTVTCSYGDPFPFSVAGLNESMTFDQRYYVKCIRLSGHDNNNSIETVPTTVTEDADYVVAYGIRGSLVAYTVNFLDEAGNTLADSQTYYGNEGDKPVIAYLYIDGYEPQAYNLTRTLSGNEAENVFDFVYSEIVIPTPVPAAPAPTPVVYEEPTAGGEAAGAAGGEATGGAPEEIEPAPAPGGEEAAGGETAGTEGSNVPEGQGPAALPEPEQQAQEPVDITGNDTPLNNGPAEIIDLDDTPSGEKPEIKEKPQSEIQQEREQKETMLYVSVGLLGVALIAIVALVVLLVKKRGVKR